MNKLLIITLFLASFNLFSQMESTSIGWATFYNDAATDFSKEFQAEMADQLMRKFNAVIEIDNYAQDKEFMLFVGMTELKTIYQNGCAFVLVEIIAPNSYSKTLTAYWKADDNKTIVKSDSANYKNVQFGWCSDFDSEFFRSFASENLIKQINGVSLNFKYATNIQSFPDLTIEYKFISTPTLEQLEKIKSLLAFGSREMYSFGIFEYEGKYLTVIDFKGIDVQAGLKEIEQFIFELNSSEVSKGIESIEVY